MDGVNNVFLPVGDLPDGSSERMAGAVGGDCDGRWEEGDGVGLRVFELDNSIKVRFYFGGGWRVEEPC